MTSVEWLMDYLDKNRYWIGNDLLEAAEQAKQMERQQIIDAWKDGYGGNAHDENEYFAETYGSKGSDECIVETNETIISDEEIEKAASRLSGVSSIAFEEGAKWYREQLKSK